MTSRRCFKYKRHVPAVTFNIILNSLPADLVYVQFVSITIRILDKKLKHIANEEISTDYR